MFEGAGLMFPQDEIQVMPFGQRYQRNNAVEAYRADSGNINFCHFIKMVPDKFVFCIYY